VVKRKRKSLSIRLQPYEGTTLAEVVEWLNSMERDEMSRLLSEAIVMAYLPYARSAAGETRNEIERCCWESVDRYWGHGFNMRQALRVPQPQFSTGPSMVMPSIPVSHVDRQSSNSSGANYSHISQFSESAESFHDRNHNDHLTESDIPDGEGSVADVDLVFGDDD
jgi:hypothetical protein